MKQLLLFLICLFFMACEKEPIEPNNSTAYFMSTKINEQNWSVTNFGDAYFTTGYDYVQKKHTLNIRAVNQDLSSLCNQLGISFDFVPKIGRYYFNNIADTNIDSGIIATFTYYAINHSSTKWSNSGYVDIEYNSKDNIKGKFNFTAKGDSSDPSITAITSGSFSVINVGGSGEPWPGP